MRASDRSALLPPVLLLALLALAGVPVCPGRSLAQAPGDPPFQEHFRDLVPHPERGTQPPGATQRARGPSNGWLGLKVQSAGVLLESLPQALAKTGALVLEVRPGSPAERGGLRVGDIVLRYDGEAVASSWDLGAMIAASAPRRRVEMIVWRERATVQLVPTLGHVLEAERAPGPDRAPGAPVPPQQGATSSQGR